MKIPPPLAAVVVVEEGTETEDEETMTAGREMRGAGCCEAAPGLRLQFEQCAPNC